MICQILSKKKELALNCPYTYLSQPYDDDLNHDRYAFPKILIPIKEYAYKKKYEHLLITSYWNGICETLIVLFKIPKKDLQVIFPKKNQYC